MIAYWYLEPLEVFLRIFPRWVLEPVIPCSLSSLKSPGDFLIKQNMKNAKSYVRNFPFFEVSCYSRMPVFATPSDFVHTPHGNKIKNCTPERFFFQEYISPALTLTNYRKTVIARSMI